MDIPACNSYDCGGFFSRQVTQKKPLDISKECLVQGTGSRMKHYELTLGICQLCRYCVISGEKNLTIVL